MGKTILAARLVGTIIAITLAVGLISNAVSYFGSGGLNGSFMSVTFTLLAHVVALVLIGYAAVFIWRKQK